MKWTDAGLMLLVLSGIAGLVTVLASPSPPQLSGDTAPQEPADPMDTLEAEFAEVCYGETFKTSSTAGDTLIRSMDLLREVPQRQANLHISRAITNLGFHHEVTIANPALGLSFICTTPEGSPVRLDLITADR